MQLSNPVAALISVPLQFNFDGEVGPANDGSRISLNVQPVIPISLNNDWNLISRTIVPVVWQKDVFPGAGSQFGISDTVQSFFLSPARPSGIVWGVGPVVLLPTGTDDLLSTRKWGAGPSALLLKQSGPWTVAVLANQIWSFAGNSSRSNVSQMLVNPFVTYTTPTAFTVAVAADVIRDWEGKRWTMPVIVNGSQMTRVGGQLVQIGGGLRYYVVSNPVSPRGFAARFTVTLLFPR
ncbi:transporter [Polymorphobacter fuscus]|uniref:Transporter n=2 Tax=Sandarakinorhabdus fusca TaxID=1439888 RepID=A0A7C9KY85_9SPHN|nr:transporter [Polymorphobacter fuscus]MQT16648.1 transporter [Polymorphobacter fuscus]